MVFNMSAVTQTVVQPTSSKYQSINVCIPFFIQYVTLLAACLQYVICLS